MTVQLEKLPRCERRLTATIPAEQMLWEYMRALNKASRRAKVDGFRPGKVPATVAKLKLGAAVARELRDSTARDTLIKYLVDNGITPASQPVFELGPWEGDGDFSFSANFEELPRVEIVDLSGLEVQLFECEVSESEIDAVISDLVKTCAEYEPAEEPAQEGWRVTVNLDGVERALFPGRGLFTPEKEAELIGAKVGDRLPGLGGGVLEIARPDLPEVGPEFFKRFGEFEDLAAFREAVRQQMQAEAAEALYLKNKAAVFEALLEAYPVEVPPTLVAQELEVIAPIDEPGEHFEAQARQRVATGILVAAAAEQFGVSTANPAELEDRVFELLQEKVTVVRAPATFDVATGVF